MHSVSDVCGYRLWRPGIQLEWANYYHSGGPIDMSPSMYMPPSIGRYVSAVRCVSQCMGVKWASTGKPVFASIHTGMINSLRSVIGW